MKVFPSFATLLFISAALASWPSLAGRALPEAPRGDLFGEVGSWSFLEAKFQLRRNFDLSPVPEQFFLKGIRVLPKRNRIDVALVQGTKAQEFLFFEGREIAEYEGTYQGEKNYEVKIMDEEIFSEVCGEMLYRVVVLRFSYDVYFRVVDDVALFAKVGSTPDHCHVEPRYETRRYLRVDSSF